MDAYLARGDSLRLLRFARATPGIRLVPITDFTDGPIDPTLLRRELPQEMRPFDATRPLKLRFSAKENRCQSQVIDPFVGTGPGLALTGTGEKDVRLIVEAPALTLISAASDLHALIGRKQITRDEALVRLTALCMELCGTYARDPWDPMGAPANYGLAPLSSTSELLREIDSLRSMKGARRAREAVLLAENGSASPRETLMFLICCLPPRLGGLGLERPELNKHIEWPREARRLVAHRSMRPDLFWPDAMVACEYNGGAHSEDERRREDDLRIQDYMTCEIKVFPANANDVASEPALRGYLWRMVSAIAASQPPAFLRSMRRALDEPSCRNKRVALLRWLIPK